MKSKDFSRLAETLTDLDKKAQDLDEMIKNVRVIINEFFWENIKTKKRVSAKSNRSTSPTA